MRAARRLPRLQTRRQAAARRWATRGAHAAGGRWPSRTRSPGAFSGAVHSVRSAGHGGSHRRGDTLAMAVSMMDHVRRISEGSEIVTMDLDERGNVEFVCVVCGAAQHSSHIKRSYANIYALPSHCGRPTKRSRWLGDTTTEILDPPVKLEGP